MRTKEAQKKPKNKSKENAKEAAYALIKQLILDMHLKPGEAVTEITLSEKLAIGRTPVREALKSLELEGLIFSSNGRKRVYLLTIKEVEEIFDLKICIEGAVVRWAAEKGKDEEMAALRQTIGKMKEIANRVNNDEKEEAKTLADWLEKDRDLHSLIFKMADNNRAEQIITTINNQWHRLRVGIYTIEGRMMKAVVEHEEFVEEILRRDGVQAEEKMKVHLANLKNGLVKMLKIFNYPSVQQL